MSIKNKDMEAKTLSKIQTSSNLGKDCSVCRMGYYVYCNENPVAFVLYKEGKNND